MGPFHNGSFLESGCDIIPLCQQLDANSTDLQGDWVKMRDYTRATIVLAKYGSEQVDTLALQLLQGNTVTGGGAKALNGSRCWYKAGTLTAATVWTALTVVPNNILAFGSSVPTGGVRVVPDATTLPFILAVDVMASEMDVEPGDSTPFNWVSISMDHTQVNNACLFSAWIILCGGRFPQLVPLSAIS